MSEDGKREKHPCLEPLDPAHVESIVEAGRLELRSRGIPGGLLDSVAARRQRGWTVGGRDAADVTFSGGQPLLVAGGLAIQIRDQRREPPRLLATPDVESFCRVADAIPQVTVVEPPCIGGRDACARLASVARAFATTGKHVLALCGSANEVDAVHRMALLAAGGPEGFEQRPPATVILMSGAEPSSGRAAVSAGLPCLVALSPAFLAEEEGGLVSEGLRSTLWDALSVAFSLLAASPEARVGLALPPGGQRCLNPHAMARVLALTQLARPFGLPVLASVLASRAASPDWLASAENTFAALTCSLAGVAAVAGAGLLDGGASVSLHELVMDAEIFSYCTTIGGGIRVDDETIALKTIERTGIGGNTLAERHTRRHMRDVWRPTLFDRAGYEAWTREGRRQSYELADDLVRGIMAKAPTRALPPKAAAALLAIAETARKETL